MRCSGGSHCEGSHSVTGKDEAGRIDPGVRAAKSYEFGKGES